MAGGTEGSEEIDLVTLGILRHNIRAPDMSPGALFFFRRNAMFKNLTTQEDTTIQMMFDRQQKMLRVRQSDSDGRHQGIIVACMDERNTGTEDALGLTPHRVIRFASGGGMISAGDFIRLFTGRLAAMPPASRRVFLMTHEVAGKPDLGCAAFRNDIARQEIYFMALRRELAFRLPGTAVHALCMDTSTLAIRPIETDTDDESELAERLHAGIPAQSSAPPTEGHAGRGIYVGEAYRAWVTGRDDYFHISASAPSLAGDLDIALSVILHHSDAELDEGHPMVLHVDYPSGKGAFGTGDALTRTVERFLENPELSALKAKGLFRMVKTSTDVETWSAQLL